MIKVLTKYLIHNTMFTINRIINIKQKNIMDNQIIKQLSSMQLEVIDKLDQKNDLWNNIISAYSTSWKAIEVYSKLSDEDKLELNSYSYFFSETIGNIASVILSHEEELYAITNDVIRQIDEQRAYQDYKEQKIVRLGNIEEFKASYMYQEALNLEKLQKEAKTALSFIRIMCDVIGADGVEKLIYQQYNSAYNLIAKFLQLPYRGYSSEEWPSMCIDELEYIKAQIQVRITTEKMAPFVLVSLETLRQQISKRIAEQKLFLTDNDQDV